MASDVPVSSTPRKSSRKNRSRNRMKQPNLTLVVCVSQIQIDANRKPDHHSLYYKIELEDVNMEDLVIDKSEYRGRSKKPITPYIKSSHGCHAWSGSAVCNSKIYSIGGNLDSLDVTSESQKEVFSCKISNTTTTSWNIIVELKSRRHSPVAITIKNNVFIFGTVAYPSGNLTPWAEVLNTKSNTIEALRSQPDKSSIGAGFILCSAVHQTTRQTKIILATSDHCYIGPSRLLYYLVEEDRWKDVTKSHSNFFSGDGLESDVKPELSVRSAVIDGVLYTYYNKKVYAYDLEYQKWFHRPLGGLFEKVECYYNYDSNAGFIINLGSDKLCVGFFSSFPHGEDKTAKLLFHYEVFSPHIGRGLKKDRANREVTTKVHFKGYRVLRGMHFVDAMIMNQASNDHEMQDNRSMQIASIKEN